VILALGLQIVLSGLMLGLGLGDLPEPYGFVFFLMWQASLFFQVGLVMGNLNALAMEPLGHIAGMAASVIGAVSTVMAAMLASPIGLMFNGTITPLIGAVLTLATLAFALMLLLARVNRQAAADPAE
jgi:DHA1 family bicyclomycin/chloramphenicol resistance-like MFS transporter